MAMHQLKAAGVKLPKIYVCNDKADVETCRSNGIPYVVWHGNDDDLIKLVFYPVLKKKFPFIKWEKLLNIREIEDPGITYTRGSYNSYENVDGSKSSAECTIPLTKYCGDLANKVNVEQLQDLKLLPKFLGEIADNIRENYADYLYVEGWNKKYGAPVGNYGPTGQAMNLIIIDVSASIPFGIAATLLSLAETMRANAQAGLIITGGVSLYFDINEPLPSPKELRRMVPRSNEGIMFAKILEEHISGKHIGNVICFGDNDSPEKFDFDRWEDRNNKNCRAMNNVTYEGTQVDAIWGYHTDYWDELPGYCLWAKRLNPNAEIHYDSTWCSCIKNR